MTEVTLPNGTKVEYADKRNPHQSEVCQLSYFTIDGTKFCSLMDDGDTELVRKELEARLTRRN